VHPVEHRYLPVGPPAGVEPANLGGDELALLLVVVRFVRGDEVAAIAVRPEVAFDAMWVSVNNSLGRRKDRRRRSVVLFEKDDGPIREVRFEVRDVANIGSPPGVDALVGVAHNGDVAMPRAGANAVAGAAEGERAGKLVLRGVRVLELVD